MRMPQTPHVLVIVQNLPVPLDRRVWLEAQALTAAGYVVTVICPKGPGDPARETIDGIAIYKYRPAPQAEGLLGFVIEFVYSWIRTAWLSIVVRRERGFDVIQACNPPDTYWLLAALWRLRGVLFIFDQHDLNPELFRSRFGEPSSRGQVAQYRGLVWLERMTYRFAHRVISTNESYRRIAIQRGRRSPSDVTVVRSGPDTTRMRPVHPRGEPDRGRHLLVYLGIMGPQDGVDAVLEVMAELVHHRGHTDVRAALLGFGDCLEDLKEQAHRLGLDEYVEFTGRVGPDVIADYLSAASVGLCPDRKTPLNDVSTMNKTMEYMAYAVPPVSFDLTETRVSAAETGLYVPSGDVPGFADAVERLLKDADLRTELSLAARVRLVESLDWRPQADRYVGVFDDLTRRPARETPEGWPARERRAPLEPGPGRDPQGRQYVDLRLPGELERFVRARGPHPIA
ncbi:glycosyltransferase family 4 protein [Pengzhenrongella phosphoraccumulans]|jgi:glycosyltransferase involved in cell wall biosynthesis|uniref:glycosyltransferase family 4 protein n=1 Tax=Pengzhenrongella phosphoraccumulans TaxID=3114394 RepID=UPI00388F151C